jgi:hypothetical protein
MQPDPWPLVAVVPFPRVELRQSYCAAFW